MAANPLTEYHKRSVMSIILSRKTLAHATAGSCASMLAMTLTYPLDRVRVMKQLSRDKSESSKSVITLLQEVMEEGGLKEIYKGLRSLVITLGISNFVYFYWYTALKALWQNKRRRNVGTLGNLLLATIAGIINVLVTNPLWVAYTRVVTANRKQLQTQPLVKRKPYDVNKDMKTVQPESASAKVGLFAKVVEIARHEGMETLWSGMGPSLILVSNPSVQFVSYEKLKQFAISMKGLSTNDNLPHDGAMESVEEESLGPELSGVEYFLLGAVAKLIATLVTYPIQIAQTRLRANRKKNQTARKKENNEIAEKTTENKDKEVNAGKYSGTFDCLLDIYKRDGIQGLYRGVDAKIMQTCLNAAFMFTAYEKIYAAIFRLFFQRKKTLKS